MLFTNFNYLITYVNVDEYINCTPIAEGFKMWYIPMTESFDMYMDLLYGINFDSKIVVLCMPSYLIKEDDDVNTYMKILYKYLNNRSIDPY